MLIMNPSKTEHHDLKKIIADYMENGFLENIIDMFVEISGETDFLLLKSPVRIMVGSRRIELRTRGFSGLCSTD